MRALPFATRPRRWVLLAVIPILLVGAVAGFFWFRPPPDANPVEDAGTVWLQDVTEAVGLDCVHDPGPTGSFFMPQSMGSGCAVIHDGDGTLYLYLLHQGGPHGKKNQLYKRLPGGHLEDVSRGSGLNIAGHNMGVAVGDVNNDGLPDVVVTQYGGLKLFLNLGGGRFEDVTEEAGLSNPLWSSSAAFVDYDRDGRLDLVVVSYLDYDPQRHCLSPQDTKEFCGP